MAQSLGIPSPATVFVSDGTAGSEWNTDFSVLQFPIVIKTDNHESAQNCYELGRRFIAGNPDEAKTILKAFARTPTRIIAQEMIPGYGTGAFFLRFGGKTQMKFAHRRLHEVPYTGGSSSFRESYYDDDLMRFGETILNAIDYEGVAMVEFRRTINGKLYFLEINGRLWGSLALALHAGMDFPRALLECYQNGAPTKAAPTYRSGIKCRNIFSGEIAHLISVLRAKTITGISAPPSKLKSVAKFLMLSLNPTIRHDWWWWSDPLPGIIQASGAIAWYAHRATQKGIHKIRKLLEDRKLDDIRLKHQIRIRQFSYFDRPLRQIMFLCYGNICRSPFAAYYWNTMIRELSLTGPSAISTGLHPHPGRNTPSWFADIAAEYNIDLTKHKSSLVTYNEVESADAIFLMDRTNYRALLRGYPWAKSKTFFLGLFAEDNRIEIADPYSMRIEEALACLHQLVSSLDGLLNLAPQSNLQLGEILSKHPSHLSRISCPTAKV
jgi:protein-tyrosine-phosphatase/predicted ATP-grasp superfamily ATP-dependent carboligase